MFVDPGLVGMITETLAIVSQVPRIQMRGSSAVVRFVAKMNASITASGRPSETATATGVTEVINTCVKVMPFL